MESDKELIAQIRRVLECKRNEMVHKIIRLKVIDSCFCDKPEDRLWHDSDKTWWTRDYKNEGRLVRADIPECLKLVREKKKKYGMKWLEGRNKTWVTSANQFSSVEKVVEHAGIIGASKYQIFKITGGKKHGKR